MVGVFGEGAAAAEEILSKPLLNQNKYLNRHIMILQ